MDDITSPQSSVLSPQSSVLSPSRIFTFWEPKEKIPYYLRLCIETWKKFLPSAQITVLDFASLSEYIDISEYGVGLLDGKFSLPQIADAIRVMLLEKYGGIWLDTDTIILNSDAWNFFALHGDNEAMFFGNPESKSVSIAAILSKPHARFLRLWTEYIKDKVQNFNPPEHDFWAYLGNSFINVYIKAFPNEIGIIPFKNVWAEISTFPDISRDAAYRRYYFLESRHLSEIRQNILLLHNSWTPSVYREMSKDEFLRCDCTMTNILCEVLEIDRSGITPDIKIEIRRSWRNCFRRRFVLSV